MNQFSQRYKAKHPTMQGLEAQLSYIDSQIKERTKVVLNNLRSTLEGKVSISNVRVLEEALPPQNPSEPRRAEGVLLSMLGSLVLSAAFFLGLEYTSQKIRDEKDLHPTINLTFLGYVPLIRELVISKKESQVIPPPRKISLVEAYRENQVLSDALASIRTHILFSMPYEKSKIAMLTSSIPDEGKTTVAVLLGLSLSAMGQKILLIDTDMRRPFLHTCFNIPNEKGLSDFLVGSAKLNEITRSVAGSDLKIITAGSETPNPSELLASGSFSNLLEQASREFDRILIDVAPVLYIPDGLIIVKHVHSSILICGSGMVHKRVVKTVKEKFETVGHKFIGVVINRADYEKESQRYKYFNVYHKHYTKNKEK